MTESTRIDALLAHSDWVDRLARRLVTDPNEADEVVQEAWLRALAAPPSDGENLRGWMARVVRRVLSRRRRAALRRTDHERRVPARRGPRTPEEVAVEVSLQRELSDAVLGLPDAYRDVMLLRYFEDMPPRKIAAQLDVPLNTVRSRLQRGSAALRAELDDKYGTRRSWALALIPLATRATIHESAAALLGLGAAATVGAATIIGVLAFAHAADSSLQRQPESTPAGVEASVGGDVTATDGLVARAEGGRRPLAPAREVLNPTPGRGELVGTVLEPDGVPAPSVRMRRQSGDAVRWQGGDRGWISGPGGSRRISAAEETRAREDPAFARELLAGLPRRDEWRATLLDTPLPGQDQRADPTGRFVFVDPGGSVDAGTVEVADPRWVGLARGERTFADGETDHVWIAARAHRIEGRVVDPAGAPIESGSVHVASGTDAMIARLPFDFIERDRLRASEQSLEGGTFLIRKAPVTDWASLTFTAPGFRAKQLPVPPVLPDPFEVVLEPLEAGETWRVHGSVRDADGRSVAGATVALGDVRTRTDLSGDFEMDAQDLGASDDLIAVAPGAGAGILRGHGQGLLDGSTPGRVDIVLDDAEGVVTGRIAGDASARSGWHLALDDPTLLEFSFSSIEKRAMGRDGDIEVDADGSFEIGGLFDRPYTLRVWRPGTGAVHLVHDVRPGEAITVDPAEGIRALSGVVVDGPGATVAVVHRTFVTADGAGGQFDGGTPAVCDGEGRFALPAVPRAGAALSVLLASGARYLVPVELIGDEREVELSAPATSILELRAGYLIGAHTLHIEDAGGHIVPIRALVAGADAPQEVVESSGGRFPMVLMPASAARAVVTRPDGSNESRAVTPVRGALVAVQLR